MTKYAKIFFFALIALLAIPVLMVTIKYSVHRNAQVQVNQVQKECQDELRQFYTEQRLSLDLAKDYLCGKGIILLQQDSTWCMRNGNTKIDMQTLEPDVAEAFDNLILTGKLRLIESLPDGVRFEFDRAERHLAVCIIYTCDELTYSKYWNADDILLVESAARIDDNWYISIGYNPKY